MAMPLIQIAEPTKAEGYMAVARELLPAVEALSKVTDIPPRGAAFVAGQTLECALNAYLSHKEVDGRKVGHDLSALWDTARLNGLEIPAAQPDWVRILNDGHSRPFYFRYQRGEEKTIVHGGSTPALTPMAAGLKEIVKIVGRAVAPRK